MLLLATDALVCLGSFLLAHFLRFEGFEKFSLDDATLKLLSLAVLVRLPFFFSCHFYHTLIRHFSMADIKRHFRGATLASLAFAGLAGFFRVAPGYSRAVFFIDWGCLAFLLIGYRLVLRKLSQHLRPKAPESEDLRRVLIWGAGDCGELCLRYLEKKRRPSYGVIGFIDDDPQKRHRRLNGAKVLGDRHHLETLCTLYEVQEIFLAVHRAPPGTLDGIARLCLKTGLPTKVFYPEVNLTATNYSQYLKDLSLSTAPAEQRALA
jgi:UDP-GlcNAc:undecaprenyl-phosphate GlcNAc-1-phosphate transferase